jgi:hypothetical protein
MDGMVTTKTRRHEGEEGLCLPEKGASDFWGLKAAFGGRRLEEIHGIEATQGYSSLIKPLFSGVDIKALFKLSSMGR